MRLPISIWRVAPRIRDGELLPRDLLEACLARIDRCEKSLRAWVLVDIEGARGEADRLGREIASGRCAGPLCGVPIAVKDIVDVAGMPTRAGSTLTSGSPAANDAPIVSRLRAAGAVIVGKTVTTPFACFDPPQTRNPWNPSHTPGGSSSGSAVAVASGMCLGAVGTQTGGSLIRPASYCGICSHKPTYGRLPMAGIIPVSETLDHVGSMARSVVDLLYLMSAMDESPGSVEQFSRLIRRVAPPRLGRLYGFFEEQASPAIRQATADACRRLERTAPPMRHVVPDVVFARVHTMHRRIMAFEAATYHLRTYPGPSDRYSPTVRALIEEGSAISQESYREALAHRADTQAAVLKLFEGLDALVAPATSTTAPADLTTTGDPSFQSPFSYTGLPTVSIPCGLDPDGLPTAIQFVGSPGSDIELLALAAWCEKTLAAELVAPVF